MKDAFAIEPASATTFWVIAVIALIMLLLLCLFGYIAWSSRNVQFEVTDTDVRISGTLYGRTIPLSSIIPESIQRVDLSGNSPFALSWRQNGVGLPGFKVGWYRLRNGEKALVYITDPQRAVYFKTRADHAVITTPSDPDAFIALVRRKLAHS